MCRIDEPSVTFCERGREMEQTAYFVPQAKNKPEQSGLCSGVERTRGIEPPTSAWEADVLPLNYVRNFIKLTSIIML